MRTPFHIRGDIRIGQPTSPSHEIDDHFVDDAHHGVVAHVVVGDLGRGVVSKDREPAPDPSNVVWSVIDQQVDVFGKAAGAVSDDGEAADQHIPRIGLVQGATDADKVFRLGCACFRSSICVIHASASSKLEKR